MTSHHRHHAVWLLSLLLATLSMPSAVAPMPLAAPAARDTKPPAGNWVAISYRKLVDASTITHSGETVGEVVRKIPSYDESYHGLVQPYLEPYSMLCQDALSVLNPSDSLVLVNITSHYPPGAAQPAWAALFREGRHQLYYSPGVIRLFLRGENPERSFEENRSAIRHAILEALERCGKSAKRLEVYAFINDYAKSELRLNTIPAVYATDVLDLSPGKPTPDLGGIGELLEQGVDLEGVEAGSKGELYFYGRKAPRPTMAGAPLSLADIAVVYRSVFHCSNNAPYISLDKHEDNRLAKVNFGGLLENTRVGTVVLEADKLFKTICTGLDPATGEDLRTVLSRGVPGFLTENERSLVEESPRGEIQTRYWFYPDSISTVTDGSIGRVQTHQFLADVERMDVKRSVTSATRKAIDHLNRHFDQYERAEGIYRELGTVGRVMALVSWLKRMNIDRTIELDELLSVTIPACSTPKFTRKLVAVSTVAYPKSIPPSSENVRDNTRVIYLSRLLDRYGAGTQDKQILDGASREVPDISELANPRMKALKAAVDSSKKVIDTNQSHLTSLETTMAAMKRALDRTNKAAVDAYNVMTEQYNGLLGEQRSTIDAHNAAVAELNGINLQSRHVVSVGGGILDLSPNSFKVYTRGQDSPGIRDLRAAGKTMAPAGTIEQSGNWVRNVSTKRSYKDKLAPAVRWVRDNVVDEMVPNAESTTPDTVFTSSRLTAAQERQTDVRVNGHEHLTTVNNGANRMRIRDSAVGYEMTGEVSGDRKRIEFSR